MWGREHTGFSLESGEPIGVPRHRLGQHLQRDVASELHIACAIDDAHAARTEAPGDFVRTEPRE
jgi:hypothetical protein